MTKSWYWIRWTEGLEYAVCRLPTLVGAWNTTRVLGLIFPLVQADPEIRFFHLRHVWSSSCRNTKWRGGKILAGWGVQTIRRRPRLLFSKSYSAIIYCGTSMAMPLPLPADAYAYHSDPFGHRRHHHDLPSVCSFDSPWANERPDSPNFPDFANSINPDDFIPLEELLETSSPSLDSCCSYQTEVDFKVDTLLLES